MNAAFGEPTSETMPFDMAHLRFPITYNLPADASDEKREAERKNLEKVLENALRTIFGSDEFRATLPKTSEPPPFPEKQPLQGRARFRLPGQALGVNTNLLSVMLGGESAETFLFNGPALWLRIMPLAGTGQEWLIGKQQPAVQELCLLPLVDAGSGSIGALRNDDGCGCYPIVAKPTEADAVVWVFTTGEIWAISVRSARLEGLFILEEDKFVRSLTDCANFLLKRGIPKPYRWVAGMEGFKGRFLVKENSYMKRGPCMNELIETEGIFREGDTPAECLRPFFERVYDAFGMVRPS
jgi:hypothetical protein